MTEHQMTIKERNILQVRAFQAVYKNLDQARSNEDKVASAIAVTSDDVFDEMLKTENGQKQIQEWLENHYQARKKRNKK